MSTPLRQQLNTILADMRTQQARIQAASERLGNATASATSKDRAIEAVVDNRGRVTALKLKGTGYRKLPPAELADRIADTIRSAQEAVARQTLDAMAGLLPTGLGLDFSEGMSPDATPDLTAMFDRATRAVQENLFDAGPANPTSGDG